MSTYLDVFKSDKFLIERYGINKAYIVWVMGLYLDASDLNELADEALTDVGDDKKIDFIKIDEDNKRIVFVQGYYSEKKADEAPANKASDLNTAAAWLISGNVDEIPSPLKEIISNCREALENDEIEQIELLYVHNRPESVNVAKELKTVQEHLVKVLNTEAISVSFKELGLTETETLFQEQSSQIVINEKVFCPAEIKFEENADGWSSAILSVPGNWLRDQYIKYQDKLFSANYRGFLGVSKRKRINAGIKNTAEKKSENFWAYNNGITILTHDFERAKTGGTQLTGISIINGAQTTGSIGSLDSSNATNLDKVKVLTRIIKCTDRATVDEIVKYNNTQNKITTWDKFSNDSKQLTISKEFADLGHNYSLKRGFSNKDSEIGIENSIQPLIAFVGNYNDANRGKNSLFETDKAYKNAFEDIKARHILFVYAINKSIDNLRYNLKSKKNSGMQLTEAEENQLNLFSNLRFKFFLIAAIGSCMETLMGQKVNLKSIAFNPHAANKNNNSINDLVVAVQPTTELVLKFVSAFLKDKNFSEYIRGDNALNEVAAYISSMLDGIKIIDGMKEKIDDFAKLISLG